MQALLSHSSDNHQIGLGHLFCSTNEVNLNLDFTHNKLGPTPPVVIATYNVVCSNFQSGKLVVSCFLFCYKIIFKH